MISVIVPVYNVEKYLRKCLDSIVNQTYRDLEIILVDDGSTDRSGVICDEYAKNDDRIRVIHKQNGGVSTARNVGLNVAKSEYITFIDSDDYIEDDTYERVVHAIVQYDPDLIFFREKSVDEEGNTIHINGGKPTGNIWAGTKEEAADLIIRRRINGMCDKVYKANILRGIYFEEGKTYGEDFMYNLVAITKVKSIAYIDEIKYSYVSNSNSITHVALNKNSFDQIYFKDVIADFVNEHFPNYSQHTKRYAFLARLRICRPIYLEKRNEEFESELKNFNLYMKEHYLDTKRDLTFFEKIEYKIYKNCKWLYKILIKCIAKHRK